LKGFAATFTLTIMRRRATPLISKDFAAICTPTSP
jgi:hypothetical protein